MILYNEPSLTGYQRHETGVAMKEITSISVESSHTLGYLLAQLMTECDIDDAKLARQTGIPASTISRMRLHPDANPTAATLRPIAKFFGITIGQLLGDETLPDDRIPGSYHSTSFTTARIPIIEWDWAIEWSNGETTRFKEKLTQWISTEKEIGDNAFALVVPTDSFGLMFRKGVLLIANPDKVVRDGDFVLIKTSSEQGVLLRQILLDGNDIYIKSVNPEMKGTKLLEQPPEYLSVVVETRFSHQDIIETSKLASLQILSVPLVSRLQKI